MQRGMKRTAALVGRVLGIVLAVFVVLLVVLTVTEYRPEPEEELVIANVQEKEAVQGEPFSVLTWNIGYGALGDNADFFMDGGKMVSSASKERVQQNMEGIAGVLKELQSEVIFLQEVDLDSRRSHSINEQSFLEQKLTGYCDSFAANHKVLYVPYPIPPIGKVECGLTTFSKYRVTDAVRVALPCPFRYPVRTANLKRCVMVSRIPVEGSDKYLVLVNLHLEAYDDGEGKLAQTKMLSDLLQKEVEKGNYVIAAGDFNQSFSNVDTGAYPILDEDLWAPGSIDVAEFGDDLTFHTDNTEPSCRSLDRPYAGADPENFQYYLIDGFIVSSNIRVESVETKNYEFAYSDHNPVRMTVTLE